MFRKAYLSEFWSILLVSKCCVIANYRSLIIDMAQARGLSLCDTLWSGTDSLLENNKANPEGYFCLANAP